jgi:polyphosphate kinase 2 (PPK2 family)
MANGKVEIQEENTAAVSGKTVKNSNKDEKRASRKRSGAVLHELAEKRHNPDEIRRAFETGEYPYQSKMRRATYEKQKSMLQVELIKAQQWVKESGQKIVLLFEGRDAAGKGGTIKRYMEHMNPRSARGGTRKTYRQRKWGMVFSTLY